jgi:hypothetical protein
VSGLYGNKAHAVIDKDGQGHVVPAHYATSRSERERHDERLVDPAACKAEWPGFREMLAQFKGEGKFTDESSHKPKSMMKMFLEWYFGGARPAMYSRKLGCVTGCGYGRVCKCGSLFPFQLPASAFPTGTNTFILCFFAFRSIPHSTHPHNHGLPIVQMPHPARPHFCHHPCWLCLSRA